VYLHFREPLVTIEGTGRSFQAVLKPLSRMWTDGLGDAVDVEHALIACNTAVRDCEGAWGDENPRWAGRTPTWAYDRTTAIVVNETASRIVRDAWDKIGGM
jgi:hypothetical protein